MIKIALSLLLILSLSAAGRFDDCTSISMNGYYLGGCLFDCIDYSTFYMAELYCKLHSGCGGITFAKKENGGKLSKGAAGDGWGYQLRLATDAVKSKNQETSWFMSCTPQKNPVSTDKCDFVHFQGKYLSGCVQGCRDFPTIDEAIIECKKDSSCHGVTFSRKTDGQKGTNAFDGVRGYQLRASDVAQGSPSGEDSWIKPEGCF